MSARSETAFKTTGTAGIIELAGPGANSLGTPMIAAIDTALTRFEESGAKVLLIVSALPGVFIAGADIKEMNGAGASALAEYGTALRRLLTRLAGLDRPSIAVIEGLALGGGLELALACSLRVGSTDAKMGLPEPRLGLIPGAGGTQRLPQIVGRARALDLLLTARTVEAAEAYHMGLLTRLAGAGRAREAALELAEEIARLSQPAIAVILRLVDNSFNVDLSSGLADEEREATGLLTNGEAAEGLSAFVEKRLPRFA
ncbi:enoyl-CoA hydratase-related protein [Arthrobacter sp. I2-34]|uniref:Enoyl-CoA hydratase-related protein n=1 Tax=Arthrobacter hankyongi TaxID=2904801 RepID=A0ABS9L3N6_9MICC|nr:enoyl-CoA hydratase-related protein [Arthrobacter hankyongi]MCG2621257.1 enoyl-CoA hydratase-related protein [Arthrobacter hankyongi]